MENVSCKIGKKMSENFNIKHLRWSKADLPKEKKKDSKERYSTKFSSSRREVYSKKRCPEKCRHLFIGISLNFMIFITFKARDKTCSEIEKAWFLLLQ